MKKSLFGIAAVAALAGMVVIGTNLEAAGPSVAKKAKMRASDEFPVMPGATNQAAGPGPVDFDHATGFEAAESFTARDNTCVQNPCGVGGYVGECGFIGNGTQGGPGPYPLPWAVSGSNAGNIEGHIDTANPFAGAQHLRLSKDVCDNTNAFSFSVDARIPASPPLPGLIAPSTYSGQISITTGLFGANANWQPQSNSQGFLTSRVLFFFYGFFYILDDYGAGLTFVPVFSYWGGPGIPNDYRNITVHHDPCAKFLCLDGGANIGGPCPGGNIDCRNCTGGANDGLPCIAGFQCPGGTCDGGTCYGRVDYWYDGNLIYQGTTYAGTTSEQFLIYTDNFPGDNDVDDLNVVTGDPCPTVCGNLEVEPGEDCDGANDDNCPGRCVDPGATGPDGEGECTCIIPGETCDDAIPLPNGTSEYISPGGWWTFTAKTPATAIEFCGSEGFDTAFYLLTGSCNTLFFVAVNDDCDVNSPYSYGYADPLASCHPVGGFPWEACTCAATVKGEQYFIFDFRVGIGDKAVVTLNKRESCDVIWENGACCDGYSRCTDDVPETACRDKGDIWTAQKYCANKADCATTLGACCDHGPGLGGLCVDGAQADGCTGEKQTYHLGEFCADIGCDEVRGACCNGFTGLCSQTLAGNCVGQNMTWTQATSCSAVPCDAVPGACLDLFNPNPKSRECLCEDGVIQANCQGDKNVWVKGAACAAVQPSCVPNYNRIPTVSEWGLVVLALLLLVGAKVYFGRREALA